MAELFPMEVPDEEVTYCTSDGTPYRGTICLIRHSTPHRCVLAHVPEYHVTELEGRGFRRLDAGDPVKDDVPVHGEPREVPAEERSVRRDEADAPPGVPNEDYKPADKSQETGK